MEAAVAKALAAALAEKGGDMKLSKARCFSCVGPGGARGR